MKKIRRGHFRFIPLNDIKTNIVSQELRRFGGSAQPIMDVINYDNTYERAVQFALSNTVVVDTINEAKHIAYNENKRIRIVTLDGITILPNGNIQGGFNRDYKEKARKFNQKELNKKIKIRDNLLKRLKHIEDKEDDDDDDNDGAYKSIEEIQNILNELDNKRKNKKFRIDVLNKQMNEKNDKLKELKKEIKTKRKILKEYKKNVNEAKNELDLCDNKILEKENEIFNQFGDELGVESIREYEEYKLQRIEERTNKKKQFDIDLKAIDNKLKFIQSKNKTNNNEIKKINDRLKNIKNEIKEIEKKKIKKLNKEINKEEKELNDKEKENDKINQNVKEKKKKIVNDKKKRN